MATNVRIKERNERVKKQIKQVKKRIDRDKLELDTLLNCLDNDLKNRPLTRSHNSVVSSFARMLAYIDKISTSDMPKDIQFLLTTYRNMADLFYTQYELSLLKEIQAQRDVQQQSEEAINNINTADDLKKFLEKIRGAAEDEEIKLKKIFPTQLQKALSKLRVEWQRLNTIAVASQTITEDKELYQALEAVVDSARFSVGIKANRIAIVPGDEFALQFFSYLKNFAVLIVPIYSVQAPWEWSIFWHELAGVKVNRLENDTAIEINKVREKLKLFYKSYQKMDSDKKVELLNTVTQNNQYSKEALNPNEKEDLSNAKKKLEQNRILTWEEKNLIKDDYFSKRKNIFSQDYLSRLFSMKRLVLRDLGGFEHQFERMLDNLPQKDKFQTYEQIKKVGWCVDWFKELFEDAWSILAIREPFLFLFGKK